MNYQVLARKWRPQNFNEMVGQDHVLRALVNALDENRLHHAYLFTGTRGVGKTTVARNFAKALNCEQGINSSPCGQCQACTEISEGRFIDLIEVDAASRTKVEDTRELLDNILYAPTNGRFKIYLIDEVHMLSNHSFNALLKTLEEPPPHVKFLLATTDPQKLPVTILSRCLQFNLKPMPPALISEHLEYVLGKENIVFETAALLEIAYAADGSMRDALSLTDQAIAYGHSEVKTQDVREMLGTVARDQIINIVQALISSDANKVMEAVAQLAQMSPDYDNALSEMLALMHQLALLIQVPAALEQSVLDYQQIKALSQTVSAEDIQLYYQIGLIGRRDLALAPDMRSGFEMILLRMLAFNPVTSAAQTSAPAAATTPAVAARPAPAAEVNSVANAAGLAAPRPLSDNHVAPLDNQSADSALKSGKGADLNAEWHGIVSALPVRGMAKQLALNCELIAYEDKFIVLNLSTEHKAMLTPSVEEQLTKALSDFFKRDLKLKIESRGFQHATPAVAEQKKAEDKIQSAHQSIENDSVVQAFKDNFGATVIEQSVRPVKD
ncbi:MAG: DNA polymerase III subunit gamma/tau [Gammaproteobacteria bacterium]|nr:DNA polymerase III subunit gamma/tau [Gammaproteobacteria bacterium]